MPFNIKIDQIKTGLRTGSLVVLSFALGISAVLLYQLKDQTQYNDTPIKFYQQYAKVKVDKNCPIKGKDSGKAKIYHLPGDSFYERLVATDCFQTEVEAQAAGFRKSGR